MREIELKNPYWITTDSIKSALIGKTITGIRFDQQNLVIELGDEYLHLSVDGDCCSSSYFYDFYGVEGIISKRIEDFTEIELDPTDLKAASYDGDVIQVYGYKVTCEPNDDYFSTSNVGVFSFRNSSNGYYGGSLCGATTPRTKVPKITTDVREAQEESKDV